MAVLKSKHSSSASGKTVMGQGTGQVTMNRSGKMSILPFNKQVRKYTALTRSSLVLMVLERLLSNSGKLLVRFL